jgi:transposase-like protein
VKTALAAQALACEPWEHGSAIEICPITYLNNVVGQDRHGVKRVVRPIPGFKAFEAAQSTLTGIELMHMLHIGQLEEGLGVAE